jgi:hypothetical protein
MKFRLSYTGRLPSSSKTPHHSEKMAIRRALHPQLAELWKTNPVLEHIKPTEGRKVGEWQFVPLVIRSMSLICEIDVLMLRRQEPGGIIRQTGDIDNQLTTLFDALKMPEKTRELGGLVPDPDEKPFFCLLEDDALITRVNVNTDRLLEPLKSESEVKLLIQATVKATRLTSENRYFAVYDTQT